MGKKSISINDPATIYDDILVFIAQESINLHGEAMADNVTPAKLESVMHKLLLAAQAMTHLEKDNASKAASVLKHAKEL